VPPLQWEEATGAQFENVVTRRPMLAESYYDLSVVLKGDGPKLKGAGWLFQ